MPQTTARRRAKAEMRAVAWCARHPGVLAVPGALAASAAEIGPITTGSLAGGLAASGLVWARAHPESFSRHAAPRLRAGSRRWGRYAGLRWKRLCESVDLVAENRRTGDVIYPRVLRVAAPTPSIDRVTVRLAPGQSLRIWQDYQDELAAMLGAESLGITRTKPDVLVLTVVRANPFTAVVPASPIPQDAADVNLSAIVLGETEYGEAWCEPLLGNHWFGAGATGSGKSSLIWNPLRQLAPAISSGLVRVWMIDPKGGMETRHARSVFYRWADHVDDGPAKRGKAFAAFDDDDEDDQGDSITHAGESALALVRDFRADMRARQATLAARGIRKVTISAEFPLNVLMIDEFAMLSAFGERGVIRDLMTWLGEILTQGRAAGFSVCVYVQEPTKDIVPLRDLFTRRICLAQPCAAYVDMVLGEDARLRGALADQIPLSQEYAGIGFRIAERSRNPIRIRAGHVADADMPELIRAATGPALGKVIDLAHAA
jgi:S-DNA-T family DNA segregation ATPase FtsK/SpoIIIE